MNNPGEVTGEYRRVTLFYRLSTRKLMSDDTETTFDQIATAYRDSQGGPVASGNDRRRLYGLFRQATRGDVDTSPPGFFQFHDQLKYRAWKALEGTPRAEAKQRFVKLARQLGYRDPGDSPVPWISTETWRREESWTNPDQTRRYQCIHEPEAVSVDPELCDSPLTVAFADERSLPPKGGDDDHLQRLRQSPDTYAFQLHEPRWPICCRRLTVLVGYRGVDASFSDQVADACLVERSSKDSWFDDGDDFEAPDIEYSVYGQEQLRNEHLLFHCHDCGTVYVSAQQN